MATNGLNKITERILSAADEAAEKILAGAREECDRLTAEYETRAAAVEAANERDAGRRAEDLLARARSSAAMQGRTLVGEAKSRLINEVFENAFRSVRGRGKKEYTDLVAGLLVSALKELAETEERNRALYGEEEEVSDAAYEILLNEQDRAEIGKAVVEAVKKQVKGVLSEERIGRIVLAEQTANVAGGAILRNGEIEANCSLEMLFSQLRRDLETEVSRVLFAAENA